jgi:hypothetical protein
MGWELRGCDTLFEYICGSFVMSQQAGKALGNWTAKIGDLIVGGQPPTFKDVGGYESHGYIEGYEAPPWYEVYQAPSFPDTPAAKTPSQLLPAPTLSQDSDSWPEERIPATTRGLCHGDRDKLQCFTNVLFEDDTHERWNPKVRELLVMALLLRYEQFLDILRDPSHPEYGYFHPEYTNEEDLDPFRFPDRFKDHLKSDGFTSIQDHLFIRRIERALEKAGVDKSIFNKWTSCARNAFLSRNLPGIPIEKFSLYGGDSAKGKVLMDPRCFVDHFNALASTTQSTHILVHQLRHQLNDVTDILRHVMSNNNNMYMMAKSIQRIENHLMGPTLPTPKLPSNVIKFSIASKGLTNRTSVTDVTVAFFVEDYRVGFELDKKSESWNDLEPPERKRLRNYFGTIKRAVRMVLMHADSYPLVPEDPSKYKETVRRIATTAEERIRKDLDFDDKNISIYKLTKHPSMKSLENTIELPDNTPEDARKFCNAD